MRAGFGLSQCKIAPRKWTHCASRSLSVCLHYGHDGALKILIVVCQPLQNYDLICSQQNFIFHLFVQGQESFNLDCFFTCVLQAIEHCPYTTIYSVRHCRMTKASVIRARVETAEAIISNTGQNKSHEEPFSSAMTAFRTQQEMKANRSYVYVKQGIKPRLKVSNYLL